MCTHTRSRTPDIHLCSFMSLTERGIIYSVLHIDLDECSLEKQEDGADAERCAAVEGQQKTKPESL